MAVVYGTSIQLLILAAVICFSLFVSSSVAIRMRIGDDAPPVIVPKQTPLQQQRYQELSANAQMLSDAATPALLELIDTPEFRRNISNLEMFTNQSALFILNALNSYVKLTAITHGLPDKYQATYLDLTLNELVTLPFLPNQFERISMGNLNVTTPIIELLVAIENEAEVTLFGFPNFTVPFSQIPLNQSQNRVSYGALDLFRPATSTQYYGAVQLVLSPSYISNMTILSPFDTGGYSTCCLLNVTEICPQKNCDGVAVTLGTLEHFNHLYGQNMIYLKYYFSILFQRLFGPPMPYPEVIQYAYFEADVMGNLLLPESVQYVIGDFTHLFGTPQETVLRDWCNANNLPLVWGKGFPGAFVIKFPFPTGPQNESFVDPLSLQALSNVTVDESVISAFESLREIVNTTISYENFNSTSYWDTTWALAYSDIIPANLHFHYLKPLSCANTNDCFGTDDNNDCFCL